MTVATLLLRIVILTVITITVVTALLFYPTSWPLTNKLVAVIMALASIWTLVAIAAGTVGLGIAAWIGDRPRGGSRIYRNPRLAIATCVTNYVFFVLTISLMRPLLARAHDFASHGYVDGIVSIILLLLGLPSIVLLLASPTITQLSKDEIDDRAFYCRKTRKSHI